MTSVRITRSRAGSSIEYGTPGVLEIAGSPFKCATRELAWLNNENNVSCFPPHPGVGGMQLVYRCTWRPSAHFGGILLPHIEDVAGRFECMIHKGNLAGCVARGYQSDVEGCVLVGAEQYLFEAGTVLSEKRGPLKHDQWGVSASGPTFKALEAALGHEPFELTVGWA